MDFIKELILFESERSSQKEAAHVVGVINNLYTEWKKTGRRKNAVDIISTTANKLSNIDPTIIDRIHEASKIKLASLLIRCFDIPYWKNVSEKERLYKKVYPIIQAIETIKPNVDSDGNVRETIMTRLSASITYNSDHKNVFVAYEPKIPDSYLRYMFGKELPERTFRMAALSLPAEFSTLVSILTKNHEKAVTKFLSKTDKD